jgi:hypothetical protein
MSQSLRICLAAAVALAGVLSAGCQSTYQSETVLHDDGSVERAVYQPLKETPEAAQQPGVWKQVTFAPDPQGLEKQGFVGSITALPLREADKDLPYFAAWGKFAAAKDLPEHVLFKAPEKSGLQDSRLTREYARTDYGFVVEHRWRETLTDAVRQDDMRRARDELGDLVINLLADTFDEAVGADYDARDLVKWARTDGKAWFAEMTDFLFLHCATHKGPGATAALALGLADVCERYGLKLTDKNGKFLDKDAAGKALEEFALDLVCKHVVSKKDRKPVDRQVAAAWLKELKDNDNSKPVVFRPAMDRVIADKYGGKDALDQRLGVLLARTFGIHWGSFLFDNVHFDYTLTAPGEVVETNGQLLAGNKVRWQFSAQNAYPLGYDMTCRCLVPQADAQKMLLKGQPLDGKEAMLRFTELVAGHEELRAALVACREKQAVRPLYEHRDKALKAGDGEEVKRVNRLLPLLKLPADPPAGG